MFFPKILILAVAWSAPNSKAGEWLDLAISSLEGRTPPSITCVLISSFGLIAFDVSGNCHRLLSHLISLMKWRRVKHSLIVASQPYCRRSSTPPTCHSLLNRKQTRHIACDPRHGVHLSKTNMLSDPVSNPSVIEYLPQNSNSTPSSPSMHYSRHDNVLRQRHIGNKGAHQRRNAGKMQAPLPISPPSHQSLECLVLLCITRPLPLSASNHPQSRAFFSRCCLSLVFSLPLRAQSPTCFLFSSPQVAFCRRIRPMPPSVLG